LLMSECQALAINLRLLVAMSPRVVFTLLSPLFNRIVTLYHA
jgi:hypothetical protein